jgi:hypothetical protein
MVEVEDLLFQLQAWTPINQLRRRENDAENALDVNVKTSVVNVLRAGMTKVTKFVKCDVVSV